MKNKNLSSRCHSASIFTPSANAKHPTSSLFFKAVARIGIVPPVGYRAHFFQVHFTSVILSTKTIKLIGRGVYNPAIIILEWVCWGSSYFIMTLNLISFQSVVTSTKWYHEQRFYRSHYSKRDCSSLVFDSKGASTFYFLSVITAWRQ